MDTGSGKLLETNNGERDEIRNKKPNHSQGTQSRLSAY